MAQQFEVRDGAASVGSFSGDQIKQFAEDGTLNAGMQIRRLPDGAWAPLSNVKGLHFGPPPATSAAAVATSAAVGPLPAQAPAAQAAPADSDALGINLLSQAARSTAPPTAAAPAEIECPFCSELIMPTATRCKHCGETLGAGSQRRSSGRTKVKGVRLAALALAPLVGLLIYGGVRWRHADAEGKRLSFVEAEKTWRHELDALQLIDEERRSKIDEEQDRLEEAWGKEQDALDKIESDFEAARSEIAKRADIAKLIESEFGEWLGLDDYGKLEHFSRTKNPTEAYRAITDAKLKPFVEKLHEAYDPRWQKQKKKADAAFAAKEGNSVAELERYYKRMRDAQQSKIDAAFAVKEAAWAALPAASRPPRDVSQPISFVEADAIWRDEQSKLEALQKDDKERQELFSWSRTAYAREKDPEGVGKMRDVLRACRHAINVQKDKVDAAYAAREAAKH